MKKGRFVPFYQEFLTPSISHIQPSAVRSHIIIRALMFEGKTVEKKSKYRKEHKAIRFAGGTFDVPTTEMYTVVLLKQGNWMMNDGS